MILPFDETGHFTCSQKRTFSLANDTDGLAITRPEPGSWPQFCSYNDRPDSGKPGRGCRFDDLIRIRAKDLTDRVSANERSAG